MLRKCSDFISREANDFYWHMSCVSHDGVSRPIYRPTCMPGIYLFMVKSDGNSPFASFRYLSFHQFKTNGVYLAHRKV